MLNSKDRGKCRNSSGKRFRIERPPIKSWQFPANFEGNPFFPSLVYDAWQFNRGWDALHFCFTNPNYPRGDNILPFFLSLQLQRIREKLEAFFIFNASGTCQEWRTKWNSKISKITKITHCANFQESSIELKNSCLFLSKKVEKTELKKKVCFDRIEIILDEIYTSKIKTLLTI